MELICNLKFTFIFRSVQLFYDGETKFNGIPGYHYVTKPNFLNEIGPEYATDCFCVDKIKGALGREDGCLYSGALDLTDCIGEFNVQECCNERLQCVGLLWKFLQ